MSIVSSADHYVSDGDLTARGLVRLDTWGDVRDWAGRLIALYDCENDIAEQIFDEIARVVREFDAQGMPPRSGAMRRHSGPSGLASPVANGDAPKP